MGFVRHWIGQAQFFLSMVRPLVLQIQVWRVLTDSAEEGLLRHDRLRYSGLSPSIRVKWQNQDAFDECTTRTKIGVGDREGCKEIIAKETPEELEANMTAKSCEQRQRSRRERILLPMEGCEQDRDPESRLSHPHHT